MLTAVLPYLRCPTCEAGLATAGGALRCPRGHSFDLARQGYAPLSAGPVGHPGDSAEMVRARQAWYDTGGYDFILDALAEAVGPAAGLVVDVGAGTGRHLAAVLDRAPDAVGLAVDTAKPALRRAARAHRRAAAVRADAWQRLPVADGCAAALLNVFGPRNGPEFRRVLRADGALIVVTPAEEHLVELVTRLDLLRVDPDKPDRIAASLHPWFEPTGRARHVRRISVDRVSARHLIGMGPSARHGDPAELAARLPERVTVTAAVHVARYRPRAEPDRR